MGGHAGHGHAHADDDDDEEDERPEGDQGENWYAGGERRYVSCESLMMYEKRMTLTRHSGISVQNPDRPGAVPGGNLVRDLLRRAAE